MKHFTTLLLTELHEILLHNELGETNKTLLGTLKFETVEIVRLVTLFSKAYSDMKYAVVPQLPLELAVIEWCENSQNHVEQNAEPSRNVIARNPATPATKKSSEGDRHAASAMTQEDEEVSVSSLRKQAGNMKKIKALYGDKATKTPPAEEEVEISTSTVELMHTNGDGTVTKEWMEHFWKNFIDETKKYNHTVAGVLRGCKIKSYADQKLIIQTAYKFHKERLDDMKNREALLKIAKLLTGKDVEITVELKK